MILSRDSRDPGPLPREDLTTETMNPSFSLSEGILNTPSVSNSTSGSVTPNVVGMGLKDAVYLLENMGIKVQVKGRGKIISQSLPAGTALGNGVTVLLELS